MSEESTLNPPIVDAALIDVLRTKYQEKGGLSAVFELGASINSWSPVTSLYISDNGGYPDLARGEIEKRLADINVVLSMLSSDAPSRTIYHDIPSQDWRAGAFDLAQLARDTVRGPGNSIFINCAPRLEQRGRESGNQGEGVYITMLPNGTVVSGVSAHSFSFFRDLVEQEDIEIYPVHVQTKGSQFRSRDFFPWFAQILAFNLSHQAEEWKEDLSVEGRRDFLNRFNFINTRETLELRDIPEVKGKSVITRVDTHGNLKLALSRSDVLDEWVGVPLDIQIKGKSYRAVLREHMFDNDSEGVGLAPGSSGNWPDSRQSDPRFLELALMGRNLREEIGITAQDLKEGLEVQIVPIDRPERDSVYAEPIPERT